jgi:hypothetical protein
MGAENVERAIRAGVIIGDDRVYLLADVTQSVGKDQRLVAQPCDPDQQVILTQQCGVACENALAVAQLPDAGCRDDHDRASVVMLFDHQASLAPRSKTCDELSPLQCIELLRLPTSRDSQAGHTELARISQPALRGSWTPKRCVHVSPVLFH